MTITTYTDREIALRHQLAAATQLAKLNGEIAAELKADKLALEAAIESSRKQEEAVAWLITAAGTKRQEVQLCKPYRLLTNERVRPLYAAPVVAPDVPDMFWNANDSEKMHTSISEFLNDKICNGTELEVGAIFTIQQAKRLQDIRIKVTSIDDNECEADYEVIDAAMGGAND